MLLECDRLGQVLWMSDRARSVLGDVNNLASVLAPPMAPGKFREDPTAFCVWRIYEAEGRSLLSLQRVWPQGTDVPAPSGLKRLEDQFRDHSFRLEGVERKLSAYARRNRRGGGRMAIRQIEWERQRLGRDLHNGIGQVLAAIRLQLETIARQLPDPPLPVQQALDRISALAAEALEQVRSVSRLLHPPEWQRLTLAAALSQLWEMSGVPQQFGARLSLDALPQEPDPEVKALLYRAAQEGLSNLARHSQASHVVLSLAPRESQVVLTVMDDGVGFDANAWISAPASVASGLGLRSIREHAAALGGKLEIASGPKGTTLVVSAPFTAE
jgi:signal transduction histidine kinase